MAINTLGMTLRDNPWCRNDGNLKLGDKACVVAFHNTNNRARGVKAIAADQEDYQRQRARRIVDNMHLDVIGVGTVIAINKHGVSVQLDD